MSVKIRLKRTGRHKDPHYRLVAVDSRVRRDGKVLDNLGHYHPQEKFPNIVVDSEKVEYWLGRGAQMTDTVNSLLSKLRKRHKEEA